MQLPKLSELTLEMALCYFAALRKSIVFDKLLVCSMKPHRVNNMLVQIVPIAVRGAFIIVHRGHIVPLSLWVGGGAGSCVCGLYFGCYVHKYMASSV